MKPSESQLAAPESDAEIARTADTRPIESVAADLDLEPDDVVQLGRGKAKLTTEAVESAVDQQSDGKLVLVTAMTPTPAGAGKTVTTIGLAQAMDALGESSLAAIREPSLGPIFGMKGGATGGGRAQVVPMVDINLHFTGDIHAVTAAHNLVAATLDNTIYRGNELDIDVDDVVWPRALDVDDRALRNVEFSVGGSSDGIRRESEFVITAASELMAILGVAEDVEDLRERVGRAVVAYDVDGNPVVVDDLGVTGAVTALLRDALRPNLVQTLEGTPAFVHGGPFANIAHGTNTLVADHVGLSLADFVVTEAGFGADLGAEKFFDIVARHDLLPDAVVLVATVRALKHHGTDGEGVDGEDVDAVRAGFPNLDHHVDVLRTFGVEPVVAINRFPEDTRAELDAIQAHCRERGLRVAVSEVYQQGSEGGADLAREVRDAAAEPSDPAPLYDVEDSIESKIETVATEVYGADGVTFTDDAENDVERLRNQGFADLPICISKVPGSLSDDADELGVPEDWTLTVSELYPSAGAGFVVALTGNVLTMPGLPAEPAAETIDVDDSGNVTGL